MRRAKLPLLATCDLMAPSVMLGLTLGRVGCLVGAVLFRWLGSTFARSVRTMLLEQEAASRARPETVDPETVSSTQS